MVALISLLFISSIAFLSCNNEGGSKKTTDIDNEYAGSESCRECHERFYSLWSPSHHGKAMQPIDSIFLKTEITPHEEQVEVEGNTYQMVETNDSLFCMEYQPGKEKPNKLPVVWALGGRNVFYFLTPWDKGRLQTLPLAYDVNTKKWYNNPASGVRHFADPDLEDAAVDWRHSLFTFNTTCHSCHVSQLEKNYDANNNTYHTIWKEPGINCETCHGPSAKHAKVMYEAAKNGTELELSEMEIITTSTFTPEQHNSSCSPCHAKMSPITTSYPPGERFYDHFNLVTLENPDFYPDGRDLGENYTYDTWSQNKCQMESDLHCVSCHTSSGRNRFAGHENANNACIKCHEKQATNFEEHTHHKTEDVTCISCHMPKTMFARMTRSDHSFRPPMPAATIAFGSPNSCNICHEDKSPQWANKFVTKWKGEEYQKSTLYYGELIKAARDDNNFSRAQEMLKAIKENKPNEIFVASYIRLLEGREVEGKTNTLVYAANNNPSPLVRSAAIDGLRGQVSPEAKDALIKATQDTFRLVRVSAGATLAYFPDQYLTPTEKANRDRAFTEYKTYLIARPDHWSSHYNLGNFDMGRGNYSGAIDAFEKASQLEPEIISPYVNASLAYSYEQNYAKAEEKLKMALSYAPEDAATNVNYGLLLGELGRYGEAKKAYRTALKSDPTLITAAYNLSIIIANDSISKDSISEVLKYSKMAYDLAKDDPKYAYTHAYFLKKAGKNKDALKIASNIVDKNPNFMDAYMFMESIYAETGDKKQITNMYEKALKNNALSAEVRQNLQMRFQYISQK